MKTLAIDIETYSSTDLTKSGVYKYVEAPDFEILLMSYRYDNGPVEIVDLYTGGYFHNPLPKVFDDIENPSVLKTAWNANFERACIKKYTGIACPAEQWECTMSRAALLGLPLSLEATSKILKLPEKLSTGKALIRFFSVPCKPTKTNGQRKRNLPEHAPDKWEEFKKYCAQDVVTEQAIRNKIKNFEFPATEKLIWNLDQRINDGGVLLDPEFVKSAISIDTECREKLTAEAIELTGLDNPNSTAQLKKWINQGLAENITTLNKEAIPAYIESTEDEAVKRVLNIRQEMAKTSVTKYVAMRNAVCADSRVRGMLQYYGANRTGRWAGRLVQVHNLPRMTDDFIKSVDIARQLVKDNDIEMLQILFGNVPDTLSQLIRTSFIAPGDHQLFVTDFKSIEAVILSWLAGEQWRLDVFNSHGKIYEASASHMFKIPMDKITKELRQRGKITELALGYGGGPNALISMGALKMGVPEDELPKLVAMWRNANKAIVKYWETVEDAAMYAVETGASAISHNIKFFIDRGILFIKLPSGRCLSYLRPRIVINNKFGMNSLQYEGMNQTTKQWGLQDTYGGKLVENIVQAIARDCLADAMLRLDKAGYKIVMHVHDEIIMEMPVGKGSIKQVNEIMGQSLPWAKGLPLKADSYETNYYKKD